MRKLCLEHAQLYDKLYPSQRSCLHGSVLDTPNYGFKLQRIHFGKQPHGKIHIHCECSSIFKSMYFLTYMLCLDLIARSLFCQ